MSQILHVVYYIVLSLGLIKSGSGSFLLTKKLRPAIMDGIEFNRSCANLLYIWAIPSHCDNTNQVSIVFIDCVQ